MNGKLQCLKKPETILSVIGSARIILETAGITGKRAALALDKLYRHYVGESALVIMQVAFEVSEQGQFF